MKLESLSEVPVPVAFLGLSQRALLHVEICAGDVLWDWLKTKAAWDFLGSKRSAFFAVE